MTDDTTEQTPMAGTRLDDPATTAEPERFVPTPLREGEARDDSALLAPPEWLLLVLRRREDGTFVLVRRPEAGAPTLLSTWPPHPDEGLEAGIASVIRTHLGLTVEGAPRLASSAHPARMGHPFTGGPSMGLLRAVALEVSGTPDVSPLYESSEYLPTGEAAAALATDLERAIFRDGAALLVTLS